MIRRALILLSLAGASLSGCTLTTGGFHECDTNEDCGDGRICQQNYCVVNQVPEGCGTTYGRDEPNAISIGAAVPFTANGQIDQSEQQDFNAVLLALDEINQREGVNGRPFVLHFCDTAGDAEKVRTMVAWLADEKKATTIITSGSAQTIAAANVTIDKGVLLMTATATSPEITSIPDKKDGTIGLVWRTAPSDALQGSVIADQLLNDPQFDAVKKVGVLYVKDPYGDGLANVLISTFGEQTSGTPKQLQAFSYDRGGDVSSAVTEMSDFDPDLTVLVAFPEDAVRILNAAAATANLSPAAGHQWFLTDSAKDPTVLSGITTPNQLDGAFGTAPAQGAGAAYSVFESSYKSKYGLDPAQVGFTSHSYDMMYLIALGSAYAVGSDGTGELSGARIAEGLTRVSSGTPYQLKPSDFIAARAALQANETIDVVGASGTLNFNNELGEAPGRIELWKVDNGAFVTVEMIDPPGS